MVFQKSFKLFNILTSIQHFKSICRNEWKHTKCSKFTVLNPGCWQPTRNQLLEGRWMNKTGVRDQEFEARKLFTAEKCVISIIVPPALGHLPTFHPEIWFLRWAADASQVMNSSTDATREAKAALALLRLLEWRWVCCRETESTLKKPHTQSRAFFFLLHGTCWSLNTSDIRQKLTLF